MSKCMPKDEEFIYRIKRVADNFRGTDDIKCYYDAHPLYAKRDYVLEMTVGRFGYKWDSYATQRLKDMMRGAGATRIIGKVRHAIARDYIDLAFDKKVRKRDVTY